MADILFVAMETGCLTEKSSTYFLLSKTHSILLVEKIARFAQIKKLSYLPIMCGLLALSTIIKEYVGKLAHFISPPNHVFSKIIRAEDLYCNFITFTQLICYKYLLNY